MNARQEAKLTMYRVIELLCTTNAAVIAEVPAFLTAFNEFKAIIASITSTTQLKDLSLTGIAVDKGNSKQNLAQMASDTAGIIFAFACATDNNTLKQEVNLKYSKLLQTRDDLLAPRCQNIHDRGLEHKAELADYGITPAKLADLQTAIDNYTAESPKPRSAVNQRKTYFANLREYFKQADEILKHRMDLLLVNFKQTHPDFVLTYESARIIIDPRTTTTQLKGKVTDAADGTAVNKATVTVVELGKTAQTNGSGAYSIKPLGAGRYTVRFSKTGFADFEVLDFDVKLGEITILDAKLMK